MKDQKVQKKKKISLSAIIGFLVCVVLGGLIGWFGASWLDTLTGGNDALLFVYLALFIVGMVLAFFTQIIIHEGGHLIFGLMSGYRFVSFNILGFIWQKGPDGKLHLGRMQIAGAGGQCLMAPPDYNEGRFPFTLYNLGGVLMNLLSAALFALLAWLIPITAVRVLLAAQIFVAVVLGGSNGLPLPVEAIQNDGTNLLCIRRDLNARRAFWLQMTIAAELGKGSRLKDMPDEWFAPFPEEAMDNPIIAAIAVMNTSRLMDGLNFDAAENAIRTLLARKKGILGIYRMTMRCDGAVCEMLAGRPADLTASLEDAETVQLMKAMPKHPTTLRTQYAAALLKDRDVQKAETLLQRFNDAAQHHPIPQEVTSERELISAIQQAALKFSPDA